MALPIQAGSLSDITQIASNPPKYPRNPTEPQKQSLVLYIERIPGSKDIILTPIKPRLKNVTAEDVTSSLYFLHLQTPDDQALLESVPQLEHDSPHPPTAKVVRKALAREIPLLPPRPQAYGLNPQYENSVEEKADPQTLGSGAESGFIRKPLSNDGNMRRPLGPRPLQADVQIPRKPLSGEGQLPFIPPRPSGSPTRIPTTVQDKAPNVESQQSMPRDSSYHGSTSSGVSFVPERGFTLTIIRRDPVSNAQWNIGHITSQVAINAYRDVATRPAYFPPTSYPTVLVDLATPGYSQFIRGRVLERSNQGSATPQISQSPETGFQRVVFKELEPSAYRGLHAVQTGEGNEASIPPGAYLSRANVSELLPGMEKPKAKGYTFASPWNGICEMKTGLSGKSLKCRHSLPNYQAVPGSSQTQGVATVSELRFNLPNTTKSSTLGGHSKSRSVESGKRLGFKHFRNKSLPDNSDRDAPSKPPMTSYSAMYPSDDEDREYLQEDDQEDQLDLSLGQEKAGGGNRGKRAKLGKLIVHDEGLKMLDLVVAANMGVFFQTWGS